VTELLQVIQLGNPMLRQIAEPILDVSEESVQILIDRLIATLKQSKGVGIAAPQVAVPDQLLVVASHPNPRYPDAPEMEPLAMINPRLVDHAQAVVKDWEGCLSVPGIRGLVPRYQAIAVEYIDRHGKFQQQDLSDFVARIFQHEFDHLSGKVFLDRLESTQDIITDQEYLKRIVQK
jgi:peptide deformylase